MFRRFSRNAKRLVAALLPLVAALFAAGENGFQYELISELERPGAQPMGAILEHSDGNLYGTTLAGGAFNQGTVFLIGTNNALETLHSFSGENGAAPIAGLAEGLDGTLYGTTSEGGAQGFGVAFKITPAGAFTKLLDFTGETGAAKGSVPNALVQHPNGTLYGTTQAGGANSAGTAFALTPGGTITTLIEFSDDVAPAPGRIPVGALAIHDDKLYGMTQAGGDANQGTIFRLTTAGAFELSRSFTGTSGAQAGSLPSGSLLLHSDGSLYGTTERGGANGTGVAFTLTTAASPVFNLLHTFADASGSQPSGRLAQGLDNNLYGTTVVGGAGGWGTIYRLTTAGSHSVLANFTNDSGTTQGASPRGGFETGTDGTLFGTSTAGGPGQRGVVFKTSNNTTYGLVSSFTTELGWSPSGAPISDRSGNLIFPMAEGGPTGSGSIVSVDTNATLSLEIELGGDLGASPLGTLLDTGTEFIGVTTEGSSSGRGGVFKFNSNADKSLLAPLTSTAGEASSGPLLKAANGNFFGVSRKGGFANKGVIFKIDGAGVLSRAFSFSGATGTKKGARPIAPLVQTGDGQIYGLTRFSEFIPNVSSDNSGTLFKIDSLGAMSSVIEFSDTSAHNPSSGLALAANGKYYATTLASGTSGDGAVIEFDSATQLWSTAASFDAATTGSQPDGPLLAAADGNFYGFATAGGNGFGAVYRFDPESQNLDCLVAFTGADGPQPGIPFLDLGADRPLRGGLEIGSDGQLYGVTPGGGSQGGGVVFRIRLSSSLGDWKQEFLGDANALDSGDPDKDGLSNLEEYLFGKLPQKPDNRQAVLSLSIAELNGSRQALQFSRDRSRNDIDIFVEASASPAGPWTTIAQSLGGTVFSGAAVSQILETNANIEMIRIHDTKIPSSGEKRFLRLRITP